MDTRQRRAYRSPYPADYQQAPADDSDMANPYNVPARYPSQQAIRGPRDHETRQKSQRARKSQRSVRSEKESASRRSRRANKARRTPIDNPEYYRLPEHTESSRRQRSSRRAVRQPTEQTRSSRRHSTYYAPQQQQQHKQQYKQRREPSQYVDEPRSARSGRSRRASRRATRPSSTYYVPQQEYRQYRDDASERSQRSTRSQRSQRSTRSQRSQRSTRSDRSQRRTRPSSRLAVIPRDASSRRRQLKQQRHSDRELQYYNAAQPQYLAQQPSQPRQLRDSSRRSQRRSSRRAVGQSPNPYAAVYQNRGQQTQQMARAHSPNPYALVYSQRGHKQPSSSSRSRRHRRRQSRSPAASTAYGSNPHQAMVTKSDECVNKRAVGAESMAQLRNIACPFAGNTALARPAHAYAPSAACSEVDTFVQRQRLPNVFDRHAAGSAVTEPISRVRVPNTVTLHKLAFDEQSIKDLDAIPNVFAEQSESEMSQLSNASTNGGQHYFHIRSATDKKSKKIRDWSKESLEDIFALPSFSLLSIGNKPTSNVETARSIPSNHEQMAYFPGVARARN